MPSRECHRAKSNGVFIDTKTPSVAIRVIPSICCVVEGHLQVGAPIQQQSLSQAPYLATECRGVPGRFPQAAELLADGGPHILAFTAFPRGPLEAGLVEQPAGTAQQGDPAPH